MRSRLTSAIAVLGVVALLLVGGNTAADAASGAKSFLLGKSNHTKKQTTITRTKPGTVLSLNAKPGSPALAVNSSAKVANLNADTVDGLDSTQLQTRSYVFTKVITAAVTTFNFPISVPAGTYLATYSVYVNGATNRLFCSVLDSNNVFGGLTEATPHVATTGLSGAGVVTKTPTGPLGIACGGSTGAFTTSQPIQVTLTPTSVAGGSALRTTAGARVTDPR